MKFAKVDAAYLKRRKEISAELGPRELWSVMDHWPLYCGVSNLARVISIMNLFNSTATVPGHVAEFGTWRGSTLMLLAKLLRINDPHGSKIIHCFDSFEGLSAFAPSDGHATSTHGQYRGNLAELQQMIELYELQDDIVIHQGLIENTLPPLVKEKQELTFSFVYCDTDLYASTKLILDSLHDRLSIGGLFVLDEWNYENFPGETVAVREFMEASGGKYEMQHVPGTRQPSLALRRVR